MKYLWKLSNNGHHLDYLKSQELIATVKINSQMVMEKQQLESGKIINKLTKKDKHRALNRT